MGASLRIVPRDSAGSVKPAQVRFYFAEGFVIITRDSKIQRRHAELHAVSEHNARMVALASEKAKTVWNQLEVLMTQWRRIEALTEESGPFIYRASRSCLSAVDLLA